VVEICLLRCDQLKNKSSRRVTYGNPCYSIGSKANSIYFLNDCSVVCPMWRGWRHIQNLYIRARTDYANRACNVTCNVMLVAKLVPRTADEPSAQRTASILRSLIDRTPFHRHRDEFLCCKKSNSAHNICLSLIHTRRINNSTSFRFTAQILLTTS
jgi:hypothetical protein